MFSLLRENMLRTYRQHMMEFLENQVWTGEEGLQVYSEVHQTLGNIIIHALFLPVITYSVLRWVYVLFDKFLPHKIVSRLVVLAILIFYGNFYSRMGFFDTTLWFSLTLPIVLLADCNQVNSKFQAGIYFLIPLLVQEIIGHTMFEGVNSRLTLSHVTNAVLYSPMFYTRAAYNFMYLFGFMRGPILMIIGNLISWKLLTRKDGILYRECVLAIDSLGSVPLWADPKTN